MYGFPQSGNITLAAEDSALLESVEKKNKILVLKKVKGAQPYGVIKDYYIEMHFIIA